MDLEVLKMRNLTATAQLFEYPELELYGRVPTENISGTLAKYDVWEPRVEQDVKFVDVDGASQVKQLHKVGSQNVNMFVSFKHKQIGAGTLNDLRSIGTLAEKNAQGHLTREQNDLTYMEGRLKDEIMMWMALKGGGTIYIEDTSKSWDSLIPSSHKPNYSGTPWSTTGTDIISDIVKIKNLIREYSGKRAVWCFHNSSLTPYLINNTKIGAYLASTAEGQAMVREGAVTRIGGLNFVEYDGGYGQGASYTNFIPDGYIVVVPEFDMSWFSMMRGSLLVPNDNNTDLVEVQGDAYWARVKNDPVGIKMWMKTARFPALKVPKAVVYAHVA